MKILDRYILKTYLKTFLSVFFILMLIFVLQAIWLYIGELAGKDLSLDIIYKFLLFATPTLIPLILPLTILLASIMVFGSFAENYEFAAMKSTGISLQRAMRGLSIFIVLLGIVTFIFSNNVIPAANFNFYNLRKNIAQKQPALVIAEGQFNQLGDINIKVENKSGDRGQFLENVIIHKKRKSSPGNYTVMKAKSGELKSSINSNVLQLVLYDGHYYDEIQTREVGRNKKRPFVKSSFEEYLINVDLAGIEQVDMEDMSLDNRFNMLNIRSLNYTIDSLEKERDEKKEDLIKTLYNRTTIGDLSSNISPEDKTKYDGDILDLFDISSKIQLLNLAANTATSTGLVINTKTIANADEKKWLNKHIISLHEKLAIGFACIILFFVGAPLGALIRKGGIGFPMVIAILLFLCYHFLGIFAKNSSENGSISPILGSWLSTLVMLPLGIYLTSRATKDRGLFELGLYTEPLRKFLGLKSAYKINLEDGNTADYSFITDYSNDKLIDVIKNYEDRNLDKQARGIAYRTLLKNGISNIEMRERGVSISEDFIKSSLEAKKVIGISKLTFIIFLVSAIALVLHFVFANNNFPQYSRFALLTSLIGFGVYLLLFIFTAFRLKALYNMPAFKAESLNLLLFSAGLPLYLVTHFLVKNKINDDLRTTLLENVN